MEVTKVDNPITAVRITQYPSDNKNEFLLVGRSNVGKSSFINTIVNRKNFARTSAKPGKTQTVNFYLCNDSFYLIDAPGYGYALVSHKTQQKFGLMIEEYLKGRPNLKHVFLLVDYRHKPTEDDILMYNFLKYYHLPVTIVCTKYDKVNKSARDKQEKIIKDSFEISPGDEVINFSSLTKTGRDRIYAIIDSYDNKEPIQIIE